MDATIIQAVVSQIFTIAASIFASGVVTTLVTQALKWKAIAVPAEKYPTIAAAMLSLVVSAGSIFVLHAVPTGFETVWTYVIYAAVTLLVATQSYNVVKSIIVSVRDGKSAQ